MADQGRLQISLPGFYSPIDWETFNLMVSIYINGASPKEKAQELEISIWACYKRINRMLSKLRQELEIEE